MKAKEEKNESERKERDIKIALVGSPNVGKSTLFNKLIGGRRSIVEDKPGITRDRLYAKLNIKRFLKDSAYIENGDNSDLFVTFIDTAGLFFEEDTLFEAIQKQVIESIKEADYVLFVVDGRVGSTSIDRKIASWIREFNKPVLLLVNKLDSSDLYTSAAEFYSLGMGEPFAFSCKSREFPRLMTNVFEKLFELGLPNENISSKPIDTKDIPKFVLLGKPNTGKSSLLNKILGYERALVHDKAGTTRDAIDTELVYKDKSIMLIDTAGLRRKTKVHEDVERFCVDRSIKGLVRADVAILVIDANDGISNQEQKLAALIQKRYKGCVIVLNKWDLVEERDFEAYKQKVLNELGFVDYAPLIICSAKTGKRVSNILDEALEVYENLHKRIKTNVLNEALREITFLKKVNSKLKVYYMSQVETNPPSFLLFVNDPKHLDENYLKFLERSLREEFGFKGVPFKWDTRKSK